MNTLDEGILSRSSVAASLRDKQERKKHAARSRISFMARGAMACSVQI